MVLSFWRRSGKSTSQMSCQMSGVMFEEYMESLTPKMTCILYRHNEKNKRFHTHTVLWKSFTLITERISAESNSEKLSDEAICLMLFLINTKLPAPLFLCFSSWLFFAYLHSGCHFLCIWSTCVCIVSSACFIHFWLSSWLFFVYLFHLRFKALIQFLSFTSYTIHVSLSYLLNFFYIHFYI